MNTDDLIYLIGVKQLEIEFLKKQNADLQKQIAALTPKKEEVEK